MMQLNDENSFAALRLTKEPKQKPINAQTNNEENTQIHSDAKDQIHEESSYFNARLNENVFPMDKGLYAVGLMHGSRLTFHGRVLILCLSGQIDICGFAMSWSRNKHFLPCYSPTSHSLLTISVIQNQSQEKPSHLMNLLPDKIDMSMFDSVVLLRDMSWDGWDDMHTLSPMFSMFNTTNNDENIFGLKTFALYDPKTMPTLSELRFGHGLSNVVDSIRQYASNSNVPISIATCGSKNMGKSTISRYLVNQLLSRYPRVAHLECDIGQCEFTVSGNVSLTIVDSPLLGPPFTHPQTPECIRFVGQKSPDVNPRQYFESVVKAWKEYTNTFKSQGIPIVINTMGWIKNMGLDLLMQTLQLTRPSHVIQLHNGEVSSNAAMEKNLPDLFQIGLTTKVMDKWWPWRNIVQKADLTRWKPQMFLVKAADSDPALSRSKVSPNTLRDLATVSYFTSCLASDYSDLDVDFEKYPQLPKFAPHTRVWNFDTPITSQAPYFAPFSVVKANDIHRRFNSYGELLYLMNASIVGLVDSDGRCVGTGIVRALDELPQSEAQDSEYGFYLLTPLSEQDLSRATLLLRSQLEIPACLMYQDEKLHGSGPYATTKQSDSTVLGSQQRKVRRNITRRPEARQ